MSTAGNRPIYLSFFGTGFRVANLRNTTCSIEGVPVPVVYAGRQGTPGVDQINIRLLPEVLDNLIWQYAQGSIRINGVDANSFVIEIH